jgi:hypothetical protein
VVVWEALLVVGKGGGKNVEDSLFVEVDLDCGLMNDVN